MKKDSLIAKLPPQKGEDQVIANHQDLDDIVDEVLAAHQAFSKDYDLICGQFAGDHVEKKLWDFCKNNLKYKVESEKLQRTKSPTVLLNHGYCDCKGYAGFVAGILDGLNRSGQGQYDWCYRFATYEDDDSAPGHVFVVVRHRSGRDVWIDPVLDQFNKRHPEPLEWEDKARPMTLVRMSGVAPAQTRTPVSAGCCGNISPLCGYRVGTLPAAGFTPDQLGIPIAQAVFQKYPEFPGAIDEIARNPPVRFFVGNNQIPLPPAVTHGGQAVPMIPNGLRLVWDSTFMGKPIPADMLNVAVSNGMLKVFPQTIASVGDYNATNDYLWNHQRWLLFLYLGALENLIYSYSSYPWGNKWDDLAGYLHDHRDYNNWLAYYDQNQKTFFGNVLQQTVSVVSDVQTVAAPFEAAVLSAFVPGLGTVAPFLLSAGLSAAKKAENKNTQATNNYVPGMTDPNAYADLPGGTGPGPVQGQGQGPGIGIDTTGTGLSIPNVANQVVQFAQANPLPAIGIAAAIGFALYEIFND
jgi:hypothetical protein